MQCPAAWTFKYCKLILSLNVLKISIWNILQRNKGEDWYFYMYSITGHLLCPYVRRLVQVLRVNVFYSLESNAKPSPWFYQPYQFRGTAVGKHTLCNWGGCPGVPILLHTKLIRTVFAQSPEIPCFNSAWAYRHSFPTLPPPPSASDTPKAAATSQPPAHLHDRVPLAGTLELPPGLPGRQQPLDQPGACRLLHLPVCLFLLWRWQWGFEKLCPMFSPPISWGEGTCWETGEAAEPFFRISRNWTMRTARMGWVQQTVHYTWKKATSSHSWTSTNWPLTKMTPFVWLHWDSLPEQAGETEERTGWPCNQLVQMGTLKSGRAEYLFDKHILGDSANQSSALGRLPRAPGWLPCHHSCACMLGSPLPFL